MLVRCLTSLLFFCAICACDHSVPLEEDARKVYEKTIEEWDNGNIESAMSGFSQLERDYLSTATATLALKERKRRTDGYLLDHSHGANQQRNPHHFARGILSSIDKKINETGFPPVDLVEIAQSWPAMHSAQDCLYSVSKLNSTYRLDCSGVEEYTPAKSNPETVYSRRYTQRPTSLRLSDFEKASPTVGAQLKGKRAAPKGYLAWAFYDTTFPTTVVSSGTERFIALNEHQKAAQDILSSNFGAYWEGEIFSGYREVRGFTIAQGAENVRIILDGRTIYDGGEVSTTKHVQLDPGLYRLEVEYLGASTNPDFELQMTSEKLTIEKEVTYQKIVEERLADYDVYHASVHSVPTGIVALDVGLKKSHGPVVLVLGSFEAVDWVINNQYGADIRAILYASRRFGSSLSGDIDDVAFQINTTLSPGGYPGDQKCSCTSGYFRCRVYGVGDKIMAIADISNGTLRGYTEEHSASALTLPKVMLTEEGRFEAATRLLKTAEAKFQCEREFDPDFENMISFDETS